MVLRFFVRIPGMLICMLFCTPMLYSHFPVEMGTGHKIVKEEVQEDTISLLESTLRLDIETAGYYELLAWCERLAISTRGSKKDLANRLFNYYGLQVQDETVKAAPEKVISIESAGKTDYFTLEAIDEDYILLERDVIVTIRDNVKQSIHTIQAEQILFNRGKNLITASGNVKYRLEEKGKTDEFSGESLTFDVDNWDGVFFSGISETDRTIGKDDITFYYSGATIHRTEKNIITLTNGTITSSDPKKPNYRLVARKIWVFAPGEWSILNAALFVGKVPLLYIPFFFRAGDKLFFNPAIGRRDVEGYFLQTSSYLLGEKPAKKSALSFLQIGEEEDQEYKKEIQGLYLRKTVPLSEEKRKWRERLTETETYIKVLFDLYSRLGFFTGIEGHLRQFKDLDQWDFMAALGLSRNIYLDPGTGSYTPLWLDEEDVLRSTWNSSYIQGSRIPFRFGFSNTIKLNMDILRLEGNMEYYSDPYFLAYFSNREEDIDWSALVGLEDMTQTEEAGTTEENYTQDLDWQLKGVFNVPTTGTAPYISELKLTELSMSMLWKTKETETEGIQGLDAALPGYVPESARTVFSFPEKRFFYPESYVLPQASARVSGVIFESPGKPKAPQDSEERDTKKGEQGRGVIPPWEQQEKKDTEEQEEEPVFRLPEIMKDLPLPQKQKPVPFAQKVSYSVTPNVTLSTRMDSEDWLTPADIDFVKSYDNIVTTGTGSFAYTAAVLNDLFILDNSVAMSYDFRNHFNNMNVPEEEWAALLSQDYEATIFKTADTFTLTNAPFSWFTPLAESRIVYSMSFILFQRDFEELKEGSIPVYRNETVKWDRDFITAHSLNTQLKASIWNDLQTLQTVVTLPPLYGAVEQTLILLTGPLSTTMQWGIKEEEKGKDDAPLEEWVLQPYEITEKVDILTNTYLQQYFRYDFDKDLWNTSKTPFSTGFLENNISFNEEFTFGDASFPGEDIGDSRLFTYPTLSTASLKLFWLTAQFTMRRTRPYTFEPGLGWQAGDEDRFIPESLNSSITVDHSIDPLWRNRIRISTLFNTAYTLNLIRFTENLFTLKLSLNLFISEFMKLDFSFQTENKDTYRYFQSYCDFTGQERIPFFQDLLQSFRLFDMDLRREALFKAKSIDVDLVHHLGDWDLSIQYTGKPDLITDDDGFKQYIWDRSLSIFVKWNPIPEIKKEIRYSEGTLAF